MAPLLHPLAFFQLLVQLNLPLEPHDKLLLLGLLLLELQRNQVVGLLGPEVSLVILLFDQILDFLFLPVFLNLDGQLPEVVEIVLPLHLLVVKRDNVLLLLLPVELLALEFAHLSDLFALLLEPLMGLLVDRLDVLHEALPLGLGMVVNLEWTLRSEEVRVGVLVVLVRNVLSIEGQPDQLSGSVPGEILSLVEVKGFPLADVRGMGPLAVGNFSVVHVRRSILADRFHVSLLLSLPLKVLKQIICI